MTEDDGLRSIMTKLMKKHFGSLGLWQRLELTITAMCSDFPEVINDNTKGLVVVQLEKLKKLMSDNGVIPNDLSFIDQEIGRYKETKQISLYEEQENDLGQELIDGYVRLGYGREGIMGVHVPLNWFQCKRLTNIIYQKTGMVKFFISPETTLYGKIVAEIYEHPVKIPVAKILQTKKLSKQTGEPLHTYISLFGEKTPQAYNMRKEVTAPFYVYRFITDDKINEFMLLSNEKYTIGDYIITGVTMQCDDLRNLTDSAKISTKMPFFFAQTITNRIVKFSTHEEFQTQLTHLKINRENFFDWPFAVEVERLNKWYVMQHPGWFKNLVWAWLLHARKGLVNEYPVHILIIGPKGSGKSVLINGLHKRSKEGGDVFSGVSSTLKALIPSFKYNPARIGYLAESNRFAFLDELLRCIVGVKTGGERNDRDESLTKLNDILEHQKREFASGVSKANINMTARVLAAANPPQGVHNVEDLLRSFDESFLSRLLIYMQKEDGEHVRMVRASRMDSLNSFSPMISADEFVSLTDYLWTFHATYDMKIVEAIYASMIPVLSTELRRHYDARHIHHIECLMDGVVKTRCLFEQDMSFTAKQEDYEVLKELWINIIRSWISGENIKNVPVHDRIFYLPQNCQWFYKELCNAKRPLARIETEELAKKGLNTAEYREAFIILREQGLIYDDDGFVKPHYMREHDELSQQRIRS